MNRSRIRISAMLLVVSGVVAARFIGHAAETSPGIHVDSTPINRDPQSGNSYSPVIKKVAPSVVNIYSSRIVKQRFDPFFRQFFGDQEMTHRENWLGCGIVVAPNGYILTANHVVEGADEVKVAIQNDRTYSAKVIGMDPPTDVAILKIDAKNLPAVTLGDSDQLEVGDVVLAIGNPFGIGQTVTRGIISALGRSLSDPDDPNASDVRQYQNFIQTDAAINEGNSGGALVDAEGRLIGINDAIVSPSGASAGIGFAVPINLARSVMEGFLNNGKVARGYLGVGLQDIDAGLAKEFGAPSSEGALVTFVAPDSPAAKGGLMSGDVIVEINDKVITGADNLTVTVSQLLPGSEAKVKIYRDGTAKTIPVTLAERTDMAQDSAKPDTNTVQPAKADALDGVEVQDLTPRIRRQLSSDPSMVGALITSIARDSNSSGAGLHPGDVIVEINRQPVANAETAVRLCKAALTDQIVVKIWRTTHYGGKFLFLDVDNTKPAR
ncbi:MAG TPA: Do family serine endopeptidase [Verrucomicrobiae bacterium]|nr:Do family serine endopeptidase [Verrucomicrobiae bacterium]